MPWILGGVGLVLLLGFGGIILVILAVNSEPEVEPVKPVVTPEAPPRLEVPVVDPAAAPDAAKTPATVKSTATPPPTTRLPSTVTPPPPPPTSSVTLGAFPRARATNEVDRVTAGLASCKRIGDPTGAGSIRVDFEPDGRVGTVLRAPFAGSVTGACVSLRFRAINLGKFTGTTQQIERGFNIPSSF